MQLNWRYVAAAFISKLCNTTSHRNQRCTKYHRFNLLPLDLQFGKFEISGFLTIDWLNMMITILVVLNVVVVTELEIAEPTVTNHIWMIYV